MPEPGSFDGERQMAMGGKSPCQATQKRRADTLISGPVPSQPEMWVIEYRELIRILTISDLKIKYQSSVLGFAWSLLNPLLLMLVLLVLYLVFSKAFTTSQENFALYLLIGIVTWRFLSNGTSSSIRSIVGRASLVTKIFIPRQVLVLSTVLSSFISSLLEFLVLFALLIAFGVELSLNLLLFPFVIAIYFVLVYGVSLALASLYVYYRDLDQMWEVLLQLGFFLSPVVYPMTSVPKEYLKLYMLNPVTVIMQTNRDILLYAQTASASSLLFMALAAALILAAGSATFNRLERRFAEEL
ncbi:MAG: ABC transporter permease [Methanothrix sp.]|nr:ABC transporter permease [Methanothrix sp.]